MSDEEKSQKRNIFISHRHDDSRIASALRQQLQAWGIPEECIFQSSSNKQAGQIGKSIKEEVRAFLETAKLVILIYTHPDMNWDYCMFECGLATSPSSVQSNVIVFQCTNHSPRVFRDELLIHVDHDGIHQFTHQFHKKNDFFPGQKVFAPNLGTEGLDIRSESLLASLSPLLPSQDARSDIRWGYFTLRLSSDVKDLIKGPEDMQESFEVCKDLQHEIIVSSAEGFGLRHFGYQEFDPQLSLQNIISRWRSHITMMEKNGEVTSEYDEEWVTELNNEICRSVRNDSPQIFWSPLKSVYPHINWLVCPVINEVRYRADGGVELVVYMYRVDSMIKTETDRPKERYNAGDGV